MWKKLKEYYKSSDENRTQVQWLMGFLVIPIVAVTIMLVYMLVYEL